jgi:hypothetical protein
LNSCAIYIWHLFHLSSKCFIIFLEYIRDINEIVIHMVNTSTILWYKLRLKLHQLKTSSHMSNKVIVFCFWHLNILPEIYGHDGCGTDVPKNCGSPFASKGKLTIAASRQSFLIKQSCRHVDNSCFNSVFLIKAIMLRAEHCSSLEKLFGKNRHDCRIRQVTSGHSASLVPEQATR